jgi:hypothetical protein
MKLFAAVLSVVLTISVPTLVLAKGDTVKITIESTDLPAPIEITDPAVRQFNIWSDFIIDSPPSANRVDAPVGLQHYKVSFMKALRRSHRWLTWSLTSMTRPSKAAASFTCREDMTSLLD